MTKNKSYYAEVAEEASSIYSGIANKGRGLLSEFLIKELALLSVENLLNATTYKTYWVDVKTHIKLYYPLFKKQ